MSRFLRRAGAVAAAALIPAAVLVPAAHADIATFPDVASHITSVRVSHGPTTVGVTAFDDENTFGNLYRFWLDTNPNDPGPEYKTEIYPDSDGFSLQKVANFASPGIKIACRGFRAQASPDGPIPAKIIVPRSCLGTPSKVRVAVVGYYNEDDDDAVDVVDWAPGEERLYPWVNR
jgi:hypothetical protein